MFRGKPQIPCTDKVAHLSATLKTTAYSLKLKVITNIRRFLFVCMPKVSLQALQ